MQSYHPTEHPSTDLSNTLLHKASVVAGAEYSTLEDVAQTVNEPTRFSSHFVDQMELYADSCTVATYFDQHHEWFRRCALPMTVESIGKNSYALIIGRFGSFGFELEPKIGLDLLPQKEGVYRIETVSIPDYDPVGYDVDFQAAMELIEVSAIEAGIGHENDESDRPLPDVITRVHWTLDLTVTIQFPRFIQTLPKSLIQTTGDRLLKQIVRQVSTRLTRKVLEDFHRSQQLPIPKRSKRWFFQAD
jgi:Protein of unknown function (DUF1997)